MLQCNIAVLRRSELGCAAPGFARFVIPGFEIGRQFPVQA
jgi:hypothetical protein